jgi:hypothetical protein
MEPLQGFAHEKHVLPKVPPCRNLSLGFTTKARGLQGYGPRKETRESLHMLPGVQRM